MASSISKFGNGPLNSFLRHRKDVCFHCIQQSQSRLLCRGGKKALCLRFVAAVSVSCSGDKSDKEESAGRFAMLWGFCVMAAVVDWQSVRLNDDSQRKYVDFPEMT